MCSPQSWGPAIAGGSHASWSKPGGLGGLARGEGASDPRDGEGERRYEVDPWMYGVEVL